MVVLAHCHTLLRARRRTTAAAQTFEYHQPSARVVCVYILSAFCVLAARSRPHTAARSAPRAIRFGEKREAKVAKEIQYIYRKLGSS